MENTLPRELSEKVEKLFDWLSQRKCVIAFSGGVDSATLGKAMVLASQKYGKEPPVGYFATSATSTELERSEAIRVAEEIGLKLNVVKSNEFSDERFVQNTPLRCYWCKKIRFSKIRELANAGNEDGSEKTFVLDGTNADDSKDYRPGMKAATEEGVLSPWAELSFSKAEIRRVASYWGLSVAEKPSNPCLASRVSYHLPLNDEVLRKIESAEIAIKRTLNVDVCRARVDAYNAVRVEIPEARIASVLEESTRKELVRVLREIGFDFVSLDLEGFFSGKNNRVA